MIHQTTDPRQSQAFRNERDTFGDIQVPADRYWGAQTQRYVFAVNPFRPLQLSY